MASENNRHSTGQQIDIAANQMQNEDLQQSFEESDSKDDTSSSEEKPLVLLQHTKRYDMALLKEMMAFPFSVISTNSAQNALQIVKKKGSPTPFDLIILELDQTGFETSLKIRKFLAPGRIPLFYAFSRN